MTRCTKYGGYSATCEPHRPGPDNPIVTHAKLGKFATVKDCQDRIYELKGLLSSSVYVGAVRQIIEQEIETMEKLIKEAWGKK